MKRKTNKLCERNKIYTGINVSQLTLKTMCWKTKNFLISNIKTSPVQSWLIHFYCTTSIQKQSRY